MKRLASTLLILVVSLGLLLPEPAQAEFTGLPAGLDDSPVVTGLGAPNAFDWLPNGDILIASQAGIVSRWDKANLTTTTVLDITGVVCSNGEMGLLGLAVDPDFGAGQDFVYLYYTHKRGGGNCGDYHDRANRVSRFAIDGSGNLAGEDVLIDNIPAFATNHHAGDLHFDRNGLLYVSVGDSGRDLQTGQGEPNYGNARRLDLLNGKILRITREGAIPANNPFPGGVVCSATGMAPGAPAAAFNSTEDVEKKRKKPHKKKKKKNKKKRHGKGGKKHNKGKKHKNRNRAKRKNRNRKKANDQPIAASAVCGEIFATGLRNPFRFAFDPDDNSAQQRFFINDVGGGVWEEINNGAPGADYGWNVREGPCLIGSAANCPPDPFVSPIFAYSRSGAAPFNGCNVITGGAFVPDAANVPPEFDDGDYLFADLGCARLFAFEGGTAELFASAPPGEGAVHLAFGPDGALYYTTFRGTGELRKIE